MAYDGVTMAGVCHEMNIWLKGARVERIYQPGPLEIVLFLRSQKKTFSLLCSADPQNPRVHLFAGKTDNAASPPPFCMQLRKHLNGARVISAGQTGLERILTIRFRAFDEFGQETTKSLVCEVMGKHSNIILTTADCGLPHIIGAIKTVTSDMSRHRSVSPNDPYIPPPAQDKLDLFSLTEEDLAAKIYSMPDQHPEGLLSAAVMGLGPQLCRELLWRAGEQDIVHPLEIIRPLTAVLRELARDIVNGRFEPCVVGLDKPLFFMIKPSKYPSELLTEFASVNEALAAYYGQILLSREVKVLRDRLTQVARAALSRTGRKLGVQEKELLEMADADSYRVWGELLTASLHLLRPGMSEASVPDYYADDAREIRIPLDAALHPQDNIRRYFKKYRKLKQGEKVLRVRFAETKSEYDYLESLLISIQHADRDILLEISEEMEQSGLITKQSGNRKKNPLVISQPLLFHSSDGIAIYVGRNNRQNDRLTFKKAAGEDIWLHTKDIPGAHVIIKDKNPPAQTLLEAAQLAAAYSKAAASGNVPVDYTAVRYVRKPKGAKPGLAVYDHQKTLYVNPAMPKIKESAPLNGKSF